MPFTLVEQFDWASAMVTGDDRRDYGEARYRALGFIGERLHALVFTPRASLVHVISLRKANKQEVRQYEQNAHPYP